MEPFDGWSREQLEGAARVLSAVLTAEREHRRESSYLAAARLLLEVTGALERVRVPAA